MRRIGLYGGTFDPPHLGHTEMLLQAKNQLDLDMVIVLPCGDPVHKSGVTNKQQRYEMCKIAFADADGIFVSDYEIEKPEKSYSLYTLRHFAEIYADSELYFIIGSDSLEDFPKWHKPEEIAQLCTLTIAPRAGHKFNKAKDFAEKTYGANVVVLKDEPLNISSTELRYLVQFGLDIDGYVTTEVKDFIDQKGLYRDLNEICQKVRGYLSHGRYLHTFYTTLEGMKLAKKLGVDVKKAFYACLLHDVAKYIDQKDWWQYGFVNNGEYPPPVVHAFLGALVVQKDFGVTDKEIINAIKYHTTGRPNMSDLEKIVYVADIIEITRGSALDEVRKKVYANFDEGFLACLKSSYNYAARRVGVENVHKLTKDAIKSYRKLAREKNEKRKIDQ